MNILGLHRDPWHNTGAAAISVRGGIPHFANLAEERLDRIKDSRTFPLSSARACMQEVGISSFDELDLIVLDYIVTRDWQGDFHKKLPLSGTFLDSIDPRKIHVVNHHLAHAACVYYSSPFSEAAVLVVDGRGSEKETQSLFHASPAGITLVESTKKIGIGLLYAAITQHIDFGLLQEGKTMGLAPYGESVKKRFITYPGSYSGVETDYDSLCIEDSYALRGLHLKPTSFEDKARYAFEVQEECERAMLHLARYAKERTGADYLCLSGGVALNSVANYALLQSGLFKDIFINPAASDTGIPLGCALLGYHHILQQPKTYDWITPYLGPSYSEADLRRAIAGTDRFEVLEHSALEVATKLLAENKIVANFQGRSEMGPRALGNRSILMSPLRPENKDILNARVKFREAFRPFAPAILAEFTSEYFVFDRENPYMLMVADIHPSKQGVIPAVTHVDGTGRLQTVSRKYNSRFYDIISAFKKHTGVPVLLNTSFNVAGEPIVETPEDAIRCVEGTAIDALLLGDYLLMKRSAG